MQRLHMLKNSWPTTLALACLLCANPSCLTAQMTDPEVSATILHKDSLFWQAYNACDLSTMQSFFTEDVEFYHDKGGITTGLAALTESLKKGLCGNDSSHLRREAVDGSVHVFPMHKSGVVYGAIISGDHRFYIVRPGKHEFLDSQAKFTQLWLLKDGQWKMARILSYSHGPAEYMNQRVEMALPVSVLTRYAGSYKGTNSGVGRISVYGGRLLLTFDNSKFILLAEAKDRFFTKERDLTFTFMGDGPAPAKLVVRENGDIAEELVRQ